MPLPSFSITLNHSPRHQKLHPDYDSLGQQTDLRKKASEGDSGS